MSIKVELVIREYLPQVLHMSLATSKSNIAWVCEVHFAYDDDLNFYFRSLESRRHSQEIAHNPQVAGSITSQHILGQKLRGVYFEGTAKLLKPGDEQMLAFECLKQRLQVGDETLIEALRPDGHKFYKISVDTFYVFDSRESNPGQKYELKWSGDIKT